jgi:glutamate N-acetyltransferase/amino-acid N-acetyltransferase
MAVNLQPLDPETVLPVPGVEIGVAEAAIRKPGRDDLVLMKFAEGSRVAAVFTQNSFAAAPVQVCRERLAAGGRIRALIVNSGNANCGTGDAGLAAARRVCAAVARVLDCGAAEVLPFSTGVILEPLPVERVEAGVPRCAASLSGSNWASAAQAIMTTDTVAKAVSRAVDIGGARVTVSGMAKGVGMLAPDMATMLAFIATDAKVSQQMLSQLVREVADQSFNRVVVDGDTSTNDSFVIAATGRSRMTEIALETAPGYATLRRAVAEVAVSLAQAIARDGEGAIKFVTLNVQGGASEAECVRVAKSIARSPLVKTAFFASDPNLGRLLMALGNAGVADLDVSLVDLWLGDVKVIEHGARAGSYREEDGARVMKPSEIVVRMDLSRGSAEATVWTCDFSYDYVKINAEYRT